MLRKHLFAVVLLLSVTATSSYTYAFHNGGVGACDGCHSMHGSVISPSGQWLMKGTDPSSICLNCHFGIGSPGSNSVVSPDGSAMTPGGDFYWLNKDFLWTGGASPGEKHGHNVIAQDFGYVQDATNPQSPGGTYQSNLLGCNSCHDPHGGTTGITMPISGSGSYGDTPLSGTTYGNYRLLGDSGYDGGKQTAGYDFLYDAPVAAQNPLIPFGETDASHVDYGSGISEWCANCHPDFIVLEHGGSAGFDHPVDELLTSSYIDRYNSYIKTGDLTGLQDTSYLQFVPFERGISDSSLLNPTSTTGPDTNSRIMCLTCHRAHGSAFVYGGRWDLKAELIAGSHPQAGDVGVVGNDIENAWYGRDILTEFGAGQKAFCDKCHDIPQNGFPAGW